VWNHFHTGRDYTINEGKKTEKSEARISKSEMVRYFDKLSIDRLTILSEVEGQIRISKIQTSKTKKAGKNGGEKRSVFTSFRRDTSGYLFH